MRLASLVIWFVACSVGAPPPTPDAPPPPPPPVAKPVAEVSAVAAALAHPDRPEDDVSKDADREPLQTFELLEIGPGSKVLDLMGGRGYSTELLARVVGPTGTVYVQNNAYVLGKFAEGPLAARLERLTALRIERMDQELDALQIPADSLDAAFMGLFYHDSVWMGVDRAAMNRAIFAGLKPGGVFVLTDHHAAEGSGTRDVKTLHRIERGPVVEELIAAGFVLESESDHLRHPEDDRTINVFDDAIRGKTDRFVLKLRKPAGE